MDFYGYLWFQVGFRVIHGSMSVFHDSGLVFMVVIVPDWFFMVPGGFYGFSWFLVDFYVFFMVPGGLLCFFHGFGWIFVFSWF